MSTVNLSPVNRGVSVYLDTWSVYKPIIFNKPKILGMSINNLIPNKPQEETLEGLSSKLRAECDKLQETDSKMNKNISSLKKWQDMVCFDYVFLLKKLK